MAAEPTDQVNLVAAAEVGPMTPAEAVHLILPKPHPATAVPMATGNWEAAVTGPMTLVSPAAVTTTLTISSMVVVPANPTTLDTVEAPRTLAPPRPSSPSASHGSDSHNSGNPGYSRGTHRPSEPNNDTRNHSNSKATVTPEAKPATMRAPSTPLTEAVQVETVPSQI